MSFVLDRTQLNHDPISQLTHSRPAGYASCLVPVNIQFMQPVSEELSNKDQATKMGRYTQIEG
jgi:hypothetical protein